MGSDWEVCTGGSILKIDRIFYDVSVPDFLTSSICSVQLDPASSKINLLLIHRGASGELLLKCTLVHLLESQALFRMAMISSGGRVTART